MCPTNECRRWHRWSRRRSAQRLTEELRELVGAARCIRRRRRTHRWRLWARSNHDCCVRGDCRLEPVEKIREVREKLRHEHRLAIDVYASEHGRASRRQRIDKRIDAALIALGSAAESMHHDESARCCHVREIALDACGRDALP